MWLKLWRDFKNYTRKRQICKSGDGAKKGLDPQRVQLMEKMNGFEEYVPDLFSNTLSSLGRINKAPNDKSKSIWQSTADKSNCIPSKKRKVPPVSAKYKDREDKKTKLFEMMISCKERVDDLSEQSIKLIESKQTQSSQSLLSPADQAQKNLRRSLSKIIDQYFVNLEADKRSICFEEMLNVVD